MSPGGSVRPVPPSVQPGLPQAPRRLTRTLLGSRCAGFLFLVLQTRAPRVRRLSDLPMVTWLVNDVPKCKPTSALPLPRPTASREGHVPHAGGRTPSQPHSRAVHLGTRDPRAGHCCTGLPPALRDTEQHPWPTADASTPPHTHTLYCHSQNISRHRPVCPGRGSEGQNHPHVRTTVLDTQPERFYF